MNRLKRMMVILTVLGSCMLFGAGILGYWKVTGKSGNFLTMGSFQNQIEESYRIPLHVDPGQTVDKVVNVKNTGTTDSMIRVKITKMFGSRREDGSFQEEKNLDPEMIQIHCNTESWSLRSDGYYYYTEILKAGEKTKQPLFQNYTLSIKAGNEYKGKEARIIVSMESVQAQDALEDLWQVSYRDLGITRPEGYQDIQTEVIYLGQKGGFQMTESDTDLFASFKNLTPGCARTQTVLLENKSSEEVQLYLRAEETRQKTMNEKTLQLVRELMEKYATIEISSAQGMIYQGSVSGNLTASSASMRQDLYLGTLKPNERKKLQVKLALSSEMDNEFQKLTGKVCWVFSAKGEDGKRTVSTKAPLTGDKTALGMWIALLGFSAIFLTAAFVLERSYNRREQHETDKRDS